MHPWPLPAWYFCTTEDGAPSPELSTEPARMLAELTAAIHAVTCRLGKHG
jgi:hypothetical protein